MSVFIPKEIRDNILKIIYLLKERERDIVQIKFDELGDASFEFKNIKFLKNEIENNNIKLKITIKKIETNIKYSGFLYFVNKLNENDNTEIMFLDSENIFKYENDYIIHTLNIKYNKQIINDKKISFYILDENKNKLNNFDGIITLMIEKIIF